MAAETPAPQDLTGFWMHPYDPATDTRNESGNFMEGHVPAPQLKPGVRPPVPPGVGVVQAPLHQAVVSYASQWCLAHAYPFFMRSAEGFSLVQGEREILISGDRPMGMHHIYLDRTAHPPDFEPTIQGHTIGRWDGDVLVAETVGLLAGLIPNVGTSTPTTKLVERIRLVEGKRLAVQFTWTDPALLEAPHVYEFFYERLPPETYSLENWCDASDPAQREEPYVERP